MSETPTYDRRTVLATTAAVAGTALAGCSGGSSTPTDESEGEPTDSPTSGGGSGGGTQSFDGWMENVGNYDGVVDETESDEVTVTVGAEANGGGFGFGPAAVRVTTGTTVVWEWNGDGGSHNVVANDGAFESEMHGSEGETPSSTPSRSRGRRSTTVPRTSRWG